MANPLPFCHGESHLPRFGNPLRESPSWGLGISPRGRLSMDQHEKIALKAARIQAAAILVADQLAEMAERGADPAPDTAVCERFARDLFGKLTGEPWED